SFWYGRNVRAGSMLSNRGCRAHCSFCSTRYFNGPGVRQRSVNSIVDEMESLRDTYGITQITWLDDDLFYNVKQCMAVFNEIVRRNLGMTWDAFNGVIASTVVAHPELIAGSAASGCIGLMFGIESGSPRILKEVHKPSGLRHYRKLKGLMEEYPQIFTKGFLMLGFTNETVAEIKQTIAIAQEMRLDWYSVQVLSPLPMTEMFNQFEGPDGWKRGTMHGWVREVDRQKRIERNAHESFFKLFEADDDYVPTAQELYHLWFDVDFLANYPKLLDETSPAKLDKSRKFLTEVCDNRVGQNAVTSLFLALVHKKLGHEQEAHRRTELAWDYFAQTPYWQTRLNGLNIDALALFDLCRADPSVIAPSSQMHIKLVEERV
ncbi:MAG: radical SAM protein, partial [Magnetococcus sp. YQC-5]